MTATSPTIPRVVHAYGLLGILPFALPPLLSLAIPGLRDAAAVAAAAYGALILSFLGGARWGLEVARPRPDAVVVSLAMLPTLAGLALLLLPADSRAVQLAGLAAMLMLHLAWDVRSQRLPEWYPRLRGVLTLGAVSGLLVQAFLMM